MNVSKAVCGIVLLLLWFRIIAKTIKMLGFYNNTHLLDQSSLYLSSRGVFRTLPYIWNEAFCENSWRLSNVNNFRKTLHFRYLRGLWIRLCRLWHKYSICIFETSEKGTHTNKRFTFLLEGSSDEDCVFAGLIRKLRLISKFITLSTRKIIIGIPYCPISQEVKTTRQYSLTS